MKLPGEGRFLGMLPELELAEYSIKLKPGDKMLLFSDGVTDAVNDQELPYGNGRLINAINNASDQSAEGLTNYIVEDVARWTKDTDPFDDLTLLALEVIV